MTTWSKRIDNILSVGISLHDCGINNWALTKSQCFEILEKFEDVKIAIVGGDVMDESSGEIGFSGDSWHCDKKKDEGYNDFVKRSIKETREYIMAYPISDNIYFALVP